MLNRADLLDITKVFGAPLSGQTFRNYIRAGLCSGVNGTESTLAIQGALARYPYETAIEATVSKIMLTKRKRKLVISAVAFGRYVFTKVLSNPSFIFDTNHIMPLTYEFFAKDAIKKSKSSYGPAKSDITILVSPKEEYTLSELMDIAREWCVRYAILLTWPITEDQIKRSLAANKAIEVDWSLIVQVNADTMYFLQSAPPVGTKVVIDPHTKLLERVEQNE